MPGSLDTTRAPCSRLRGARLRAAHSAVPWDTEQVPSPGTDNPHTEHAAHSEGSQESDSTFWAHSRGPCAEAGLEPRSLEFSVQVHVRKRDTQTPLGRRVRPDGGLRPQLRAKRPPPRLPAAVGSFRWLTCHQRRRRPAKPARPRRASAPGAGMAPIVKLLVANCTAEPATPSL